MTKALSRRLQQSRFESPMQEALLSVLLAAGSLNEVLDEACGKHGLTRPQYNVLRILRGVHPEGHPRCEIAKRMIERAPDITRLVDRLEQHGLVRRTRGGEDQRQALTFITAKGLKVLQKIQPGLEKSIAARFHNLSQKDCRELSRVCALIFEGPHCSAEDSCGS